jgi:hypothetical protein
MLVARWKLSGVPTEQETAIAHLGEETELLNGNFRVNGDIVKKYLMFA